MASADESVKRSSEESFLVECSPCGLDGIVREARYFCTDCQEYLCQPCDAQHKRFKGTRGHNVILCGNTKIESEDEKADICTFMCSCLRNDVELFCEYHNELFCYDCKLIKHRLCQTTPLDDYTADLDTKFDEHAIEYSKEVKNTLENQLTKCKGTLEQLNTDRDIWKEDVILFANELKDKIDTFKSHSIEDLNKCYGLHKELIDHHVNACNSALKTLSLENTNYEKTKESGNNRKRFLLYVKLTQTLNDLQTLSEEIKAEKCEPILSFERDENLSSVFNAKTLGSVKHNLKVQPRRFNTDMTISSTEKVNVRTVADSTVPWISGSAFLTSGELVLCDKNNSSIKYFDSEFKCRETVGLPSAPRDCCSTNKNEVLVTLPSVRQIHRFQTVQSLQLKTTLTLDKSCEGIDCLNEDIFVSCIDKTGKEIRIIDMEGNLKRKIVLDDEDVDLRPFYVTVSCWGQIYVTESNYDINKTQIRCFEKYGACRYTLSEKNLDGIGGMLVDEEGRLLACFWRSNTLQVISKDGTKCQKFFDSSDDGRMTGPYSISYRNNDATLILTLRERNYMLVFKLNIA